MGDEVGMGVGHSTDDLLEKEAGILFSDVVVLDIVVELATLCEFHDDEDVVGGVEYFVEFDDVLMVDEFEYLDLSFDLGGRTGTLEIMFLFFILRLLMILTATRTPVMSCRASILKGRYI